MREKRIDLTLEVPEALNDTNHDRENILNDEKLSFFMFYLELVIILKKLYKVS